MAAVSGRHTGWRLDAANSRLDMYYQGTRIGHINASGISSVLALAATTSIAATTAITAGTTIAATTTITAGTGLTVTAGDGKITAGNLRLGAINTFGTTEPTSAVVMKVGTAPAGAITTSGGIFTDGTVVKKIIAAGTVSNIET